jgi:ABC-type glycerol-3-phosphate transport system substrate-binding protein
MGTNVVPHGRSLRKGSNTMNKRVHLLLLALTLILVLAACGGTTPAPTGSGATSAPAAGGAATAAPAGGATAAPAAGSEATAAPAAAQPAAGEKVKIRFYGKIDEFTSTPEMIAALQDHFKDKYEIEMIKVDWGNLDTIIKTGILSDDPADIYFWWTGSMQTYVDAGQALDLTPYLEANNGEWKKTLIPGNIAMGKYGDKYYAVPDNQTGAAIYINDTLAQQLGVTIPNEMTWDQFLDVCAQIKSKGNGVFPFAIMAGHQSWIPRTAIMSLGKDLGLGEAFAKGEVPMTHEIFRTALEESGELYKNGYIYPGDGALTATQDEMNAAFSQQRVVMLANVFTSAQSYMQIAADNKFTLRTAMWPQKGKAKVVFGTTNGWFIPSNAKHKDEAVEVLKYWLGKDLQAIHARHGIIPSNAEVSITDPNIAKLAEYGNYFSTDPAFTVISTELATYVEKNMVPDYVLGESADSILQKMEALRQQALAKKTK